MSTTVDDRPVVRRDLLVLSGGTRCAVWLHRPADTAGPLPCVVLAHGLGAVRAARLEAFARRFAAAGLSALTFDYRYFGDSEGLPRALTDLRAQREDWSAVLALARSLPEVDNTRIALWGTSLSGGHVAVVAAHDPAIAAVISMNPFLDGRTAGRTTPAVLKVRLMAAGLRDEVRGRLGRAPLLVPAAGGPGSGALMAGADVEAALRAMSPDGKLPATDVSARILLRLHRYRPVRRASHVACPWLIQPGTHDTATPPCPAHRAAARAPRAQLSPYPGGHFTPYTGEVFERVVTEQIAFLTRHLT
ncbi:alpha/beta hydrolase [Streptomyces sp. NPDC091272]|uniref:alpha/beta hydrolase n=1 Tax=Streptomyces sp. NPDC091272 TaxID=3365981 RepID=UPI0037F6B22C